MHLPEGKTDYQVSGCVDRLIIINGRGEILSDLPWQTLQTIPDASEAMSGIIRNAVTAVEEMILINRSPEYFIFEQSPLKPRLPKKGRITRSPDRSRFVPLQPDAIRRIMGLNAPPGEGGSKSPHERRRHWRHLTSERYTHKRGQRVLVDACWVGPSEAVVGKTRYRVRLDI